MRLREGGQRLARSHLEKHPLAALGEAAQPIGEMDGVAQMADPVGGVGRLGRREVIAGTVGQDGDVWGVEGNGAQVIAKAGQDRLQHPRMGRDVDGDARGLDPRLGQTCRQIIERGLRARGHAEPRRIDRRDVECVAQPGTQRLGGEGHAEQAALGHAVEELPAQMHKPDAILEAHHACETGGGILAHGMTDEGGGGHTPALPQLRQCVFGDHDQRQLHRGLFQPLGGGGHIGGGGQPEGADVVIEFGLQHREATIHPFGKDRLCLVKIARHARILRAAAGEHEDDLGGIERLVGEDAARIAFLQKRCRFFMAGGHHDAAAFEGAAT